MKRSACMIQQLMGECMNGVHDTHAKGRCMWINHVKVRLNSSL